MDKIPMTKREKFGIIISIFLMLVGLAGMIYAGVMQCILSYQKFGIILNTEKIIIPHISLVGFAGVIPITIGYLMLDKI